MKISHRTRKLPIPNGYLMYLQEYEFHVNEDIDPTIFSQIISNPNSSKWINVMKDKLALMHKNQVYDLVELLFSYKPIECKWIFKDQIRYSRRN